MEERNRFIKRAILLSLFTIGYNLVEGVVSIYFGISDEAISLAGFGGDSLIEVGSAGLVLWRLESEVGRSAELSLRRERKATFGIGVLFIVLAVITLVVSAFQLATFSHPESTLPGLVIAALSLSFMFFLWSAKRKVAKLLDSATVMKDADCSLACIKLSAILFIGSLIFLLFPGLWWIDSAAAILLAIIIGKEGLETIQAARSDDFSGGCGCVH
ncbi:hypothetical protein MNBD_NITROSPINAE02-773 [hydrothermal vent metagenome]|uniref:Cation efflux protein transmembrane domain-containing protein n=1 Tax=hydrothermal vent metagenome TaxID=652676 RepID=A0A3B1C303_9ZZZZ